MIEVRCVRCGRLFNIEDKKMSGSCPYCGFLRTLTKIKCIRCDEIFGVLNKCKAHCPYCKYVHDCSEAEVIS